MTRTLDVLLIESHPGAGAAAADRLAADGDRVHRCYPAHTRPRADGPIGTRDGLLCAAITTGKCPLDDGIDVALLVRQRFATRPAASEGGVSCALRAGVPVVEDGPELLDPFGPWLAGRVTGDVTAACASAAEKAFQPLRQAVEERVGRVLAGAGLEPAAVLCAFEEHRHRLHVVLGGPDVPLALRQALAIRVLDAVRSSGRKYGQVDVSYRVSGRPTDDDSARPGPR